MYSQKIVRNIVTDVYLASKLIKIPCILLDFVMFDKFFSFLTFVELFYFSFNFKQIFVLNYVYNFVFLSLIWLPNCTGFRLHKTVLYAMPLAVVVIYRGLSIMTQEIIG